MDGLNYHHLHYFWVVAREGTIARAGEQLQTGQPTISAQLKKLEQTLGVRLFRKVGRRLELTDAGRRAFDYADEIFSTGRNLVSELRGSSDREHRRLAIGVCSSMPSSLAFRLLRPLLHAPGRVTPVCTTGELDALLAELTRRRLDVILADLQPSRDLVSFRGVSLPLGTSTVSFWTTATFGSDRQRRFPNVLQEAPCLMPTASTALRPLLDRWLAEERIRPRIVGEFADAEVLRQFGRAGLGIVPAYSALDAEFPAEEGWIKLGTATSCVTHFSAITAAVPNAQSDIRLMIDAASPEVLQPPESREPVPY